MATAKKLPSGHWRVQVFAGYKDGKRIYKSFTSPYKKEAVFAAAEFQLFRKEKSRSSNLTVGEAIDKYINNKTSILSPSTIVSYKQIRKNNFESIIDTRLENLSQDIVQSCINEFSSNHSPKTVRNTYGLLVSTLKEYIPTLCLNTKLPQKNKQIIVIPTRDEVAKIIDNSRNSLLYIPVLLAIMLGLRRSEICALQWSDIDWGKNYITIDKALVRDDNNEWVIKKPKTTSGTRTLQLPHSLCTELKKCDKNKLMVQLAPNKLSDCYRKFAIRLELPTLRFHDLRHYYASILLALGVPDKYAMERMGHATDNMLKSVYQHTQQEEQTIINNKIDVFFEKV